MSIVHVIDHPLVQHKLTFLRDKNTGSKEFRALVEELAMLLTYEATRDLPLEKVQTETPVAMATTEVLAGKKLGIVPILRAGLGMVDGMLSLIPAAKVGHVGLYRDPETLKPVDYYCKLPSDIEERDIIIVDPMLATGSSIMSVFEALKKRGTPKKVHVVSVIGSQLGVRNIADFFRDYDSQMWIATVDPDLNADKYIVPGLGDAGDLAFGEKL